jgi:VHL beta domain
MKNACLTSSVTAMLALLLIGTASLKPQVSRSLGVTLRPLDPAMADNVLRSSNGATRATIKFVNQGSSAVDIYWINYDGHRVLYYRDLATNSTWTADTFLTHPWLVVVSDSGGTTTSGTGVRFAGFEALTANGDTAIITNPN